MKPNREYSKRTFAVLDQIRDAVRQKYAWPGGYPLALLMSDGECLCMDCARKEWKNVFRSTFNNDLDGWQASCSFINWEDQDAVCAHCYGAIDYAYG